MGKDHKNNVEDTTYALSAFVRENTIIVSELSATLHTYKARVLDLEEKLKQKRGQIEDDFKYQANQKDQTQRWDRNPKEDTLTGNGEYENKTLGKGIWE